MIKVLQVIDIINQNSGVSSVVMNYYQYIDNSNIHIDFMVHGKVSDDLRKKIEINGSKIYQMVDLSGQNLLKYIKQLKIFFKTHREEYDVIHGHLPNAAIFYLGMAKYYKVPVRIIHSHNTQGADGIIKRFRNYVLNRVGLKMANVYFACSKVAARYLYGSKNMKKAIILHNAIDLERFSYNSSIRDALRKKYNVENKLVIGHIGRFQEQKNHMFILDIAENIKDKIDMEIILLGDGPLRKKITFEIKKRGLENIVKIIGVVSNPQDYYQMMDVFVLPSYYEGLPVVGVEAQAAGLPCLFSEYVTHEVDLTDKVYYLPINNVKIWVEAIINLNLERKNTNKQLENCGFMIQKESEKLAQLYEMLVENIK